MCQLLKQKWLILLAHLIFVNSAQTTNVTAFNFKRPHYFVKIKCIHIQCWCGNGSSQVTCWLLLLIKKVGPSMGPTIARNQSWKLTHDKAIWDFHLRESIPLLVLHTQHNLWKVASFIFTLVINTFPFHFSNWFELLSIFGNSSKDQCRKWSSIQKSKKNQ